MILSQRDAAPSIRSAAARAPDRELITCFRPAIRLKMSGIVRVVEDVMRLPALKRKPWKDKEA